MNRVGRMLAMLLIVMTAACHRANQQPESYSNSDARDMIRILKNKKEKYDRAIKDQNHIIDVLHGNLSQTNTNSMRARIQQDISSHQMTLNRAIKDKNNLDSIIFRLDSVLVARGAKPAK